jgi:uncharacterized protein involved in exopolysaccharide biosynthesis
MPEKTHNKTSNLSPHSIGEYSMSLIDVILVIAKQIKVIIIIPLILCFSMTIYIFLFSKPVYTSISKIMSSSNSGTGMSQAAGLAAQFGVSLPTNQSETKWVYPEILKSRTLAKSVLKKKIKADGFENLISLQQILIPENFNQAIDLTTLEKIAVDKLLSMIEISEDVKTTILTLEVNSFDPKLAQQVNKTLISELDNHQRKYNKKKTTGTKKFIEERIIDAELELKTAEDALRDFTTRNRRIENSALLLLEQQRLEREVTVLIGVYTTLKQQLETTKIEEVKESDYVVILDPPEIPLKRSKPNKKLMVLLSGIFGLGIGLSFAFFRSIMVTPEEKKKIKEAKKLVKQNIIELVSGEFNK